MSICKDCLHNEVCRYGENRSNGMYCTGEKCKQYKPTADMVDVVRCKDCQHWKDTSCDTVTEDHWGECRKPLGDYRYCETAENDYCSYGERREE